MQEHIRKKIFTIIEKQTNIKLSTVDPDKDIREQISLDSMQFVTIIARLEADLGIEIPISIMEVNTLNEFLSVIENELK